MSYDTPLTRHLRAIPEVEEAAVAAEVPIRVRKGRAEVPEGAVQRRRKALEAHPEVSLQHLHQPLQVAAPASEGDICHQQQSVSQSVSLLHRQHSVHSLYHITLSSLLSALTWKLCSLSAAWKPWPSSEWYLASSAHTRSWNSSRNRRSSSPSS